MKSGNAVGVAILKSVGFAEWLVRIKSVAGCKTGSRSPLLISRNLAPKSAPLFTPRQKSVKFEPLIPRLVDSVLWKAAERVIHTIHLLLSALIAGETLGWEASLSRLRSLNSLTSNHYSSSILTNEPFKYTKYLHFLQEKILLVETAMFCWNHWKIRNNSFQEKMVEQYVITKIQNKPNNQLKW